MTCGNTPGELNRYFVRVRKEKSPCVIEADDVLQALEMAVVGIGLDEAGLRIFQGKIGFPLDN